MNIQPLTKRQREVLDAIQARIMADGVAPSLLELNQKFGLRSLATMHKHLTFLEHKGYIRRGWNQSRSIQLLLGEHRHCETCSCGYPPREQSER